MRLEELLFCTIFFLVPILGMISMVIGNVLKGGRQETSSRHHVGRTMLSLNKKREKTLPAPVFASPKVMEYQLVESRVHIPLQLTRFKEGTRPRAGP